MQVREWFRPPRQVLIFFLAIAVLSTGALVSLTWHLLEQDAALEVQRRQERLEQAADRAAAVIQRALADLQAMSRPSVGRVSLPEDVLIASIGHAGITLTPPRHLLFVPGSTAPTPTDARLAEGERLEFAAGDFHAAARAYSTLVADGNLSVHAGALVRLARVYRKLGDSASALAVYDRLLELQDAQRIDGLPATLVARVGRASLLEVEGRTSELRIEARLLHAELSRGRWVLVRSEYEYWAGEAARWLGSISSPDADAFTRAEAAEWLWHNRASLSANGSRALSLSAGHAYVSWWTDDSGVHAVIAGPRYLSSLASRLRREADVVSLTDVEGRLVAGDPAAVGAQSVIRTALSTGLPWMLHASSKGPLDVSPRRSLLLSVFGLLTIVFAAGWYFIVRAISREVRVSLLQADFVAAVSHEFRSPLTSLAHIADMLAQDRMPLHARQQSFDLLVRDTDRLRRLVEDLLDFGRFDAGAAALRLEPMDIAILARTIAADFEARVAAQGYSIEVACPVGPVWALADREALSRALWNLLDNAVKYSPASHTIWVSVVADEASVAIAVRDQGFGIPVHEQQEIFHRFVRGAESKARRIRGTGIGLALVNHVVRAHGGEVCVTSEPGVGSTFTMRLPAAGAAA